DGLDEVTQRAAHLVESVSAQRILRDRAIDEEAEQARASVEDVGGMRDTRDGGGQLAAIDDLIGGDVYLDDAVETDGAREVENRIGLRLGQNQRSSVRLLQIFQPVEQAHLCDEIE